MALGFKKYGSFTAMATAVLLLTVGCAQEAPNASNTNDTGSEVTIGLTYIPNVQFSPLYVAEEDGIFAQEGLDVTLRHHGADEGLFTALTTGKEDVVIASGDEVLQARAQGMDIVSIGSFYSGYPVTLIVPEDSPIQTFADVKGMRVGVPGEYGSSWLGLLAALTENELDTGDITVVPIGYTAQASLVSGKVDAVVGFSNNDLVQLQANDIPVRAVPLSEQGLPLISASIITTEHWATSDSERTEAVVTAIAQGITSVVDDPAMALAATQVYDPTLADQATKAGAELTLQATAKLFTSGDGTVTVEQDLAKWKSMNTFLTSVPGVIAGDPRPDGAVTNDYLATD